MNLINLVFIENLEIINIDECIYLYPEFEIIDAGPHIYIYIDVWINSRGEEVWEEEELYGRA